MLSRKILFAPVFKLVAVEGPQAVCVLLCWALIFYLKGYKKDGERTKHDNIKVEKFGPAQHIYIYRIHWPFPQFNHYFGITRKKLYLVRNRQEPRTS